MDNFEAQLRQALRREEPSPDFTARVLKAAARPRFRPLPRLAAALVLLSLAAGTGWGVAEHRRHQRLEAEHARAQLVLALQISSERLNGAFRRIAPPQEQP